MAQKNKIRTNNRHRGKFKKRKAVKKVQKLSERCTEPVAVPSSVIVLKNVANLKRKIVDPEEICVSINYFFNIYF